ncbi:Uncharacterised protein [Vibrio cholerae]|uniref:Uncharacterized protein n=1 Tax=Vibrio cholerae TaxID=666 RepID=A0A655QRM7_VIBCL|nr:Uncharacterised protein [Vibrio cholerae]
MFVHNRNQIITLSIGNRHFSWVAFVFDIGCANHRVGIKIRDDEDNAFIFILQNIRLRLIVNARHDNV